VELWSLFEDELDFDKVVTEMVLSTEELDEVELELDVVELELLVSEAEDEDELEDSASSNSYME
jgi:hypothetical protein